MVQVTIPPARRFATCLIFTFLFASTAMGQTLQDLRDWCDNSNVEYSTCFMADICERRNSQVPVDDYCDPRKLISHLCNADGVDDATICSDAPSQNELPHYPKTEDINTANNGICNSHYMPGCDKTCQYPLSGRDLPTGCSIMDAYTDLCKEMPDMKRCNYWKELCDNNGALNETCYSLDYGEEAGGVSGGVSAPDSTSGFKAPVMIMYFHTHQQVPVLFRAFTPQNDGQYAGWFIAIMLFTVAGFFYRHYRSVTFKEKYMKYRPGRPGYAMDAIHILHAILRGIEFLWFYALMLISMTYNVGFFFSLGIGAVIATYVIERWFLKVGLAEKKNNIMAAEHAGDACCG